MVEIESEHYRYIPDSRLPKIILLEGFDLAIGHVSLYSAIDPRSDSCDYIRDSRIGQQYGLNHRLSELLTIDFESWVLTLETCTDKGLVKLVKVLNEILKSKQVTIKELQELREFEQRLRREVGEYRERR